MAAKLLLVFPVTIGLRPVAPLRSTGAAGAFLPVSRGDAASCPRESTSGETRLLGVVSPVPSKQWTSICAAETRALGSTLAVPRIFERCGVLASDATVLLMSW